MDKLIANIDTTVLSTIIFYYDKMSASSYNYYLKKNDKWEAFVGFISGINTRGITFTIPTDIR